MNGIIASGERGWMDGSRRSGKRRRGPSDGRHRRRVDFDRLESRRLLTLLSSPPVAEFPLRQSGGTPEGVAADPNGNGWVLLAPDSIAEISQNGSVLAEYRVPAYNGLATAPARSELGLITYNAVDGNLWFYEATSNVFGMLNPSSGAITEYPLLPFASSPVIYQIIAGPDGNIYFTEPSLNEIGVFDIKTDLISQFTMPLADTQPQGITVGGDGNLWFTEGGQNKIGSLNPNTHVITNYAFEPPSYPTNTQAEGITAGPNDTIWFVERQNNVVQDSTSAPGPSRRPWPPTGLRTPAHNPAGVRRTLVDRGGRRRQHLLHRG